MIPQRIFLEIFSGHGGLSRAMVRLGYRVVEWDVRHGSAYDLLNVRNQRLLRGWVLSGAVAAAHLGTPCTSWSRARDRPGGPPRLRSDEHLWGLPGLVAGDQVAVHTGNVTFRFSGSMLQCCRHMRVPVAVENPAGF